MCWNSPSQISLIDINADPFIEEIIDIDKEITQEIPSYEVASATMPFLDISPYKDSSISSDGRRIPGISNFFKAKLRLEPGDLQGRLKRMHRVLKKAWSLNEPKETVEYIIDQEKIDKDADGNNKPDKYLKTYEQLFTIDYVTTRRFLSQNKSLTV